MNSISQFLGNTASVAPNAGSMSGGNNFMAGISQSMPQLKQMASQMQGLMQGGGNMNEMLMKSIGQNNPMMQMLMGGGNPEQMVRQECEKQGLNFDEFMGQMQQAFQ